MHTEVLFGKRICLINSFRGGSVVEPELRAYLEGNLTGEESQLLPPSRIVVGRWSAQYPFPPQLLAVARAFGFQKHDITRKGHLARLLIIERMLALARYP
jgi:hypothetical protein